MEMATVTAFQKKLFPNAQIRIAKKSCTQPVTATQKNK
jgi:hypothetical protein